MVVLSFCIVASIFTNELPPLIEYSYGEENEYSLKNFKISVLKLVGNLFFFKI